MLAVSLRSLSKHAAQPADRISPPVLAQPGTGNNLSGNGESSIGHARLDPRDVDGGHPLLLPRGLGGATPLKEAQSWQKP
jgi:hypothetical protein